MLINKTKKKNTMNANLLYVNKHKEIDSKNRIEVHLNIVRL